MSRPTEREINKLVESFRSGDSEAARQLFEQLRPLVRALALRYRNSWHDIEDLEQVGTVGLWKAMERFDPEVGTKLTTYAVPWISGEIRTYLRRGHSLMKSPVNSNDSRLHQVARQVGVSAEDVAASTEYPFLVTFPGNEDICEIPSEENLDERVALKLWLKQAFSVLKSDGRKVIFYRYFQGLTQQETADLMGMTQKQVSRLEKKILHKMKEEMQY